VDTASDKAVRHSLAYLFVQKWFARETSLTTWKFCWNWPTPKNADFQSIFARSALAVTPSEESSLRAFHWA